jgi:hypothetical protein
MRMDLSSQGLNFLGLTAKKFAPTGLSNNALNAIEQKFEAFEQTSHGFAGTSIALNNLKSINCQAFCMIEGKKTPISEKAWDRGGILEGKMPLEDGIARGLYHIENIDPKAEKIDLDRILEELKKQVNFDAQALEAKKIKDPFEDEKSAKKFKDQLGIKGKSSLGFVS